MKLALETFLFGYQCLPNPASPLAARYTGAIVFLFLRAADDVSAEEKAQGILRQQGWDIEAGILAIGPVHEYMCLTHDMIFGYHEAQEKNFGAVLRVWEVEEGS